MTSNTKATQHMYIYLAQTHERRRAAARRAHAIRASPAPPPPLVSKRPLGPSWLGGSRRQYQARVQPHGLELAAFEVRRR